MSRALNTTTGQLVDGDLCEILGEKFRDWKAAGNTLIDGWEINPTADRIAEVQTAISNTPERVAERFAQQVDQIKARCREDILARYPDWKQANMTARALELLSKPVLNGGWTPSEQTEVDAINEAWAWIKERRAQSNAEEAALNG